MTRKATDATTNQAREAQEGQAAPQPAPASAIAAAPGDGTALAAASADAASPEPINPKRGGLWRMSADNSAELVHRTRHPDETPSAD